MHKKPTPKPHQKRMRRCSSFHKVEQYQFPAKTFKTDPIQSNFSDTDPIKHYLLANWNSARSNLQITIRHYSRVDIYTSRVINNVCSKCINSFPRAQETISFVGKRTAGRGRMAAGSRAREKRGFNLANGQWGPLTTSHGFIRIISIKTSNTIQLSRLIQATSYFAKCHFV